MPPKPQITHTTSPLLTALSPLPRIFSPTTTSLFTSSSLLPFRLRWRLFLLQPINILAALLTSPNWLFANWGRYSVYYIPTRSPGARVRCLVYLPKDHNTDTSSAGEDGGTGTRIAGDGNGDARGKKKKKKRPLHISLHGGAWVGGLPEQDSRFCTEVCNRTGAVVIALTYRLAPVHVFPSAHDDVDDAVVWILRHAEDLWDVDIDLLTISGSSVGGNLGLGISRALVIAKQEGRSRVEVKGLVGFYVPVDFTMKTAEKDKPLGMPKDDPLGWLFPVFDAYPDYGKDGGRGNREDKRLNPTLMRVGELPRRMLVFVAAVDILAKEQLEFVERVRGEIERGGDADADEDGDGERYVEAVVEEKGFHGWLELPSFVMEKERVATFNRAIEFIKDVHRRCRAERGELLE